MYLRVIIEAGRKAEGAWDASSARTIYREEPDTETPLWNPRRRSSMWWTENEVDSSRSLSIAYDGTVRPRLKRAGKGYLGFRCVREARRRDGS